jgi:hypothetical protein
VRNASRIDIQLVRRGVDLAIAIKIVP